MLLSERRSPVLLPETPFTLFRSAQGRRYATAEELSTFSTHGGGSWDLGLKPRTRQPMKPSGPAVTTLQ